VLAADTLTNTAQTLVGRDLFLNTLMPPMYPVKCDRGRPLEWTRVPNAQVHLWGRDPYARTFADPARRR